MTTHSGGTMRARFGVSWLVVASVGAACGGAPPPPPAPPPAVPPVVAVAATPDMSEAPEPNHLVGLVRWKSADATMKIVSDWTGIRASAAELAWVFIDKSLASTLALDAPIDAAMSLDERGGDPLTPIFAVSVPVRNVDAARIAAQTMGPVTETSPGTYKVTLRHRKKKGDKPFCVLTAAVGPAPGRFVCGDRERDVETLRPYLTRTLPKRDLGPADLHVEFHMAPVVDQYGPAIRQALHMGAALAPRKLQIGEPTFDRAIERMASGLSDELGALVDDIDSATIDLTMAPEGATGTGSLRLKGQQSWTAGTFASTAARSTSAPASFWHLPLGATSAYYATTPEARRYEAIRRALSDLLDGWLQHEGVASADRSPIVALLGEKFLLDSPWVFASGPFAPEVVAKSAPKAPASAPDPLQAAMSKVGWYLVGVGAPFPATDFTQALSAAANRPKFQAYLKGKLGALTESEASSSDSSSGAAAAANAKTISGLTMKPAPAPKELPKGSLAFELTFLREGTVADAAAKGAKKKWPPVKMHLLVVPEKDQTWLALGSDKTQLLKPVLAATAVGAESGTLAARQDLPELHQPKLSGGGFTTLESLLQSWSGPATWLDPSAARTAQDIQTVLATTPNKGKTPILSTDEVKTDDGIRWTMRIAVPKAVIEDAMILAASSGLTSLPHR
jgi:hypothetical protein